MHTLTMKIKEQPTNEPNLSLSLSLSLSLLLFQTWALSIFFISNSLSLFSWSKLMAKDPIPLFLPLSQIWALFLFSHGLSSSLNPRLKIHSLLKSLSLSLSTQIDSGWVGHYVLIWSDLKLMRIVLCFGVFYWWGSALGLGIFGFVFLIWWP